VRAVDRVRTHERHKMVEQMLGRQLAANFVERLDRLLAHDRLLDRRERLERREQRDGVRSAADKVDEVAELLRQCQKHLILVVDRLCAATRAREGWASCARRERRRRALPETAEEGPPLRKGMSSSRVRSGPSASAMVDSRRIELSRSWMSSFFNSSIRIATG
jgi:hypothetical protein